MAIELGSTASVQPKPGAGRAPGREAPADGEGSFASALSASSATKKSEAHDRCQDKGAAIDDVVDADTVDEADAADAAVAPAAASAASSTFAAIDQQLQPQPQLLLPQTAALPLPAESALLLAQSNLSGAAVRDANRHGAAAQPAASLPATTPLSRALPSAAAQQPAAVLQAADAVVAASPESESDAALQALSARSVGARAVPAAETPVASTTPATPATSATSATSALAASFSSALPQQTQRVAVQTQVQTQTQTQTQTQAVADRAEMQLPTATTTLDSRAAESLVAAGMAGGASLEASASPLLRRFERVLSMTHAASGEGQGVVSGGATAASSWMPPVNGAAAGAGASMGGMADRLADPMNGLLAQVMAQKNHNASLTVDVGGQPVSVNVQVQGNEAQVVFRADQAETRAMLAQALPQLKQMMGAEGLVLSDASVAGQWAGGSAQAGGSGGSRESGESGESGESEGRRRTSSARIDGGASAAGAVAGAGAEASGTRSLDLYV